MNLRFLEMARDELDQAVAWYEEQLPGLGLEFLEEIDRILRRIVAWPFSCTEMMPNIRRCLVRRFPYGVIYGVDDQTIVILAVAHLHREPRYWANRNVNP